MGASTDLRMGRLRVAGEDRTDDLGPELIAAAGARAADGLPRRLSDEADIPRLAECADEAAYLQAHCRLLRSRACVDLDRLEMPHRPGPFGRAVRAVRCLLWQFLRHPQDWVTFRQNAVNVQLAYELDFERDTRERQISDLEARLRNLEQTDPAPNEGGR